MIESFFRMKSTAKQEQLHPQNVCGSLPRGVHNSIWYRPRITTCQFLISDRRDAHNATHRLNLEPRSEGGISQFSSWSVTAGTYTIQITDLTLNLVLKAEEECLNFSPDETPFIPKFLVIPRSFWCFDWFLNWLDYVIIQLKYLKDS